MREPKVDEPDWAAGGVGEKDVLQLYVAVRDAAAVAVLHRVEKLAKDAADGLLVRQREV